MPTPPTTERDTPAWDRHALADPHGAADKAARVERMFDAIAPTYEKVNRVASFGQDARWRRIAIAIADPAATDIALDICCGTGDMIRTLAANDPAPRLVLGLDFSAQMLAAGRYDDVATPVQLIRADAQRLPLRDASVDLITCAFGVRNFQDLHAGLCEMHRVLRPGGRAVILEFAAPDNAIARWGHRLYTRLILPRVGRWISGDAVGAYRYLPQSIEKFDRRRSMIDRLSSAGFARVTTRTLNLGGVVVYRAARASRGA